MKIYLGADHAGYDLKEKVKVYLAGLGHEVEDMGAYNFVEGDDYPDFVIPVAQKVSEDPDSFGFLFGGSGQGEAMCANRVEGIRAAVFYGQELPDKPVSVEGGESADSFVIVELARVHNNANILSIGARFVSEDEAKFSCELFLSTPFVAEERHVRRISKF